MPRANDVSFLNPDSGTQPVGGSAGKATSITAAASASVTATAAAGTTLLYIGMNTVVSNLTVLAPPSPAIGDTFELGASASVGTLVLHDASNAAIAGAPVALAASARAVLKYVNNTWIVWRAA